MATKAKKPRKRIGKAAPARNKNRRAATKKAPNNKETKRRRAALHPVTPAAKPIARLSRGFDDRGPAEIAGTRRMLETIRGAYERYGFEPLETPAIEYTDALGKFLPDQERPNEGVFSFQDDDKQWLSLRYDLTAPLARYVAENFDSLPKPYRSYREGWVFRNEKPGPGRFRQFMQFDADTVGSASMAADAEMCMLAADTLEALGVPRGSFVVKVNSRKVLDGVLEALDLGGKRKAKKRLRVLRAIDKLDRLGWENVIALLKSGRRDESRDFTRGANLTDEQVHRLQTFIFTRFENLAHAKGLFDTPAYQEGIAELAEIWRLVEAAGYHDGRIGIFPSVVRGLEYYTGPVYEAELTFERLDEQGRPVRFGSIGGGGRYDGLIARFRGESVPATGFSIGVSRLMAALKHLGKVDIKPEPGPVMVTVFDKERITDYQRMVTKLRDAEYAPGKKIRAELYLGNDKFRGQLKYADERGSPCVVIQGSNEKSKGEIQVKDLIIGAELARLSKDREDHLKRQAEAQFVVPEDKLVDAVREVLARHDVTWS